MFDRYWLLTWTTYGTRLPGDSRGSVTSVRSGPGPRTEHDLPDTPVDGPMPGLEAAARAQMIGPPVYLTADQAGELIRAFRETTAYRGWGLLAAAVMADHAHLVVGVPGDPDPAALVRDLKSYASRALNRRWGKPAGGTWWAGGGGSRRKLPDAGAVRAAGEYVRRQYRPLLVWTAEEGLIVGGSRFVG
jgi:REP element-mobilizing transposase RayT